MKKYTTEIKWGVIFTLVMLLWMVFERMMGWHSTHIDKHAMFTNFFAIPAIAVYVFALLDKRKKDLDDRMDWKQGFTSGLIITVVVTILSPLAQLVIHSVITPDFFDNIANYTISTGNMTRPEAEAYFSLNNYLIQGAIGSFIMGVITSSVVAIFTRKN